MLLKNYTVNALIKSMVYYKGTASVSQAFAGLVLAVFYFYIKIKHIQIICLFLEPDIVFKSMA
jgi:hypothetical protein